MMVDGLSAALRALGFVAMFQAAGMAVFLALFGHLLSASEPAIRRIGVLAAFVAIGCVFAQYVLEAARMSGELSGAMDPTLQGLVLHSSTATALAWRLAGLVLIAVALRLTGAASVTLSLIGIMLVIGAFALTGHTATHPERWLLSLLLETHLLIVTFWFGALVPLHLASSRESAATAGSVTAAFSAVALWIVPVVLVVGLVIGAFLLRGFAGLRTTYGQLLLVKLAGFALLMGLAALNNWRLGPAIGRGEARAMAAFRRSLKAEYAVIASILGVTAVLTSFYSPD
jgi:copper resistance protein D